ncbi:MAG: AAA family ATPase [Nitriliruptorales bacterium]
MSVAVAHLVHGYIAAGKTTFSRRLETATGAVRVSADEWYIKLYVGEETTPHLDRAAWRRLMSVLDELWPVLLERDVDVILDFGFWSRAGRDRARQLAEAAGATVQLYEVICDESVARARCQARNQRPHGHFQIDRAAFDDLKATFEPLAADEEWEGVDTSGWH